MHRFHMHPVYPLLPWLHTPRSNHGSGGYMGALVGVVYPIHKNGLDSIATNIDMHGALTSNTRLSANVRLVYSILYTVKNVVCWAHL